MVKLSEFTKDDLEQYVDAGFYDDQQVIDLHAELVEAKTGTLELDLIGGVVKRGEQTVMTVEELIFLLGSAKTYNESFPCNESQKFMQELREHVGLGLTKEQFTEHMAMLKGFMEGGNG